MPMPKPRLLNPLNVLNLLKLLNPLNVLMRGVMSPLNVLKWGATKELRGTTKELRGKTKELACGNPRTEPIVMGLPATIREGGANPPPPRNLCAFAVAVVPRLRMTTNTAITAKRFMDVPPRDAV